MSRFLAIGVLHEGRADDMAGGGCGPWRARGLAGDDLFLEV